jgi:hypothetical protein
MNLARRVEQHSHAFRGPDLSVRVDRHTGHLGEPPARLAPAAGASARITAPASSSAAATSRGYSWDGPGGDAAG